MLSFLLLLFSPRFVVTNSRIMYDCIKIDTSNHNNNNQLQLRIKAIKSLIFVFETKISIKKINTVIKTVKVLIVPLHLCILNYW